MLKHLGLKGFDVDAAAMRSTTVAPMYLGPDHRNPRHRDALAKGLSWAKPLGRTTNAWCNPPYSRMGGGLAAWCERMHRASEEEGCLVASTFFAKTETVAWHDHVTHAAERYFLRGRLSFLDPDTGDYARGPKGARQSAPAPSVLVIFRPGHTGQRITEDLDLRHLRGA